MKISTKKSREDLVSELHLTEKEAALYQFLNKALAPLNDDFHDPRER